MFELRPFEHRGNRGMRPYDPFREMEDLERAFFGGRPFGSMTHDFGGLVEFKTDIQDKGDSYLLEADLPGFKKEDIHIDLDGDTMTISAERHSEHEEKDKEGNYLRCERSYGSYQRSFDISGIEEGAMKAEYADGVLKLTMPKKQQAVSSARRLEIQ
ncbi:MAG: Hsp20/alpha crystallin family protein [Oscillospiraceae bacterium]|nr:Hsp20/alpha crystallin family protein [Oscillospiraceae bacterium]